MATITTRAGKGTPLTNTEVDDNFTNLNTDKIENVVEDTTPQLGGNLDLNSNDITGTGNINVTGTVTADGLTVDGEASVITLNNTDTSLTLGQTIAEIKFDQNDPSDQGVGTVASIEVENRGSIQGLGQFNFKTGSATSLLDRLSITEGGDISFYEDTGTTAKFFWDASAESLGIGTSSPAQKFHVEDITAANTSTYIQVVSGNTGNAGIAFGDSDADLRGGVLYGNADDALRFFKAGFTEGMRLDANGNLGIGTTSPIRTLHVDSSSTLVGRFSSSATEGFIQLAGSGTGTAPRVGATGNNFIVYTNDAERMRIGSGGYVGIGTSSPAYPLEVAGSFPSISILDTDTTNDRFRILHNGGSSQIQVDPNNVSASSSLLFSIDGSEKVRLDASGNVGIGTTSPAGGATRVVDVYGSTSSAVNFHNATSGTTATDGGVVGQYGNDLVLFNYETGILQFGTSNTEAMRLDANGNLGIGDTNPTTKLALYKTGDVSIKIDNDQAGTAMTIGKQGASAYGATGVGEAAIYTYDNSISIMADGGAGNTASIKFSTGGNSEKMRLDANGNLGIGTQNPQSKLHVAATGNMGARIDSTNGGIVSLGFWAGGSSKAGITANRAATNLCFDVDSSERMRIDSSGNLHVGATSFSTVGNDTGVGIFGQYGQLLTNMHGNEYHIFNIHTSGTQNKYVQFRWGNSSVGSISTNGSTTAYNTSSDYRLKENVVDMTGAVDRVKALNPSQFNFIADPDTTVDGFLAHEVADVVPEAVTGTKDAVDADGNPEYQGIDQSKLVPLLTGALQEAIARIETLEAEVATLKGN